MKHTIRWPMMFLVGVALILPAVALAKTTHWAGSVNYGVFDKEGDRGNFTIDFNVSHGKVTYWFIGYACNSAEGTANFPTHAAIKNGKFKLDYTEPAGGSDPGFHVIITGAFKGGKASGTMDVRNDPLLGGGCSNGRKPWHAHNTG